MSSSSNLVFINTNNPQDIKSSAQRRAVRSQAAKDHSQPSSSRDDAPKRRRHRKMLTVEFELAVDDSETSRSESPPENTEFTTVGNETSSMFDELPQRSQGAGPVTNIDYSPILPMGSIPGGGWTSPFVPQPEGKSAPGILSHCMFDLVPLCSDALLLVLLLVETNQAANAVGIRVDLSKMAVDIPELDLPGAKGSLQSLWFPMVISEQAALNVVILTAAFHYISING